ncbi:MAG: UDP-glucose dehydrogenase family protein [Candidatus Binataceae bacterium]
MNIAVVGTGYVGLVSGTCFAESGNEVICVDIDKARIAQLNSGQVPIYEPGLEELVRRNLKEGRLSFTTELVPAVRQSLVSFIAVGTPMSVSGAADLSGVFRAVEEVAKAAVGYHVIVVKSTVPVGTNDRVCEIARRVANHHRIEVCSVPEFLKEGSAIEDFMRPDRVIIGSSSERATAILRELHSPFLRTDNPMLVMHPRSAELTKYASNAMLALRISFINQMANLCEAVGAEINDVRRGMGSDRRIGSQFLFPGVGYGGSCFPKDVQALIHSAAEHKLDFTLLKATDEVNALQKRLLVERVKARFGALEKRTFAVWGLAFKPRTDDMREAPSLVVIEQLLAAGARVQVHDPEALENARKLFGSRVSYHRINYEALEGADALLILTEWNEFRHPNFQRIKSALKRPLIFDGRNLYDPALMKALEFEYYSIGREPVLN